MKMKTYVDPVFSQTVSPGACAVNCLVARDDAGRQKRGDCGFTSFYIDLSNPAFLNLLPIRFKSSFQKGREFEI